MERISNATRNKTPPESKRQGEATPKVDMSKEIQWVATQKEKVDALVVFDMTYIDPVSQKGLESIGKSLLAKKRESQTISNALLTKVKSKAFKNNVVPDDMVASVNHLQEKAECVFKLCKYMSQAYITDPDAMKAAFRDAKNLGIPLPAHFYLYAIKIFTQHTIKLANFDAFAELLRHKHPYMVAVIESKQLDDAMLSCFVAGIVESTATKFLNRVTMQSLDEDDYENEDGATTISRLRRYHHMLAQHCDETDVRHGCWEVFSLLAPKKVLRV